MLTYQIYAYSMTSPIIGLVIEELCSVSGLPLNTNLLLHLKIAYYSYSIMWNRLDSTEKKLHYTCPIIKSHKHQNDF